MADQIGADEAWGSVRGKINGNTLEAIRRARFNGLSVISGSKQNLTGPLKSVTTAGMVDSSRVAHVNLTGKDVSHVALVFANYSPAGGTESSSAQIQVRAAVEDVSLSGVTTQDAPRQPVETKVGGNSRYSLLTLDRGAVLVTRPLAHAIPAGATFFTRVGVTVPTNSTSFPRGGCLYGGSTGWGTSNGEGGDAGADRVMDGAGSISHNALIYYYSESAVLGRLADGSIATSVAIGGDSLTDGVDDAGYGGPYVGGVELRVFSAVPRIRISIPGEKLADIVQPSGPTANFYARSNLAALTTHFSGAWGRNDVEQAQTLAQFKANLLKLAYVCMSRGQHVLWWTILPAPTSTDGWFTTANQTPQADPKEALRKSFNAWLTDTSNAGFVAQANAQVSGVLFPGRAFVVDRCAPVECNQAGTLTTGGGCILGAQTGVVTNGTATAGTTTTLTDSGKSWTTNAYKGYGVYIVSGTGAGQMRGIASNTATALTVNIAFSPAPDATSVYQVYKALGMNGVHPLSTLHDIVAADPTVQAKIAEFLAAV